MRLLYIDANAIHLNPTATLMPALIEEAVPDVRFYGPGFCSPAELADGLQRWIDRNGPFDVLVVGPATPVLVDDDAAAVSGAIEYLGRYSVHGIPPEVLATFFRDVQKSLGALEIPAKVISVLNFDYYATSVAQVERLERDGLSVLGPNHQFILPLEALPDFARHEDHFKRKAHRLSDRWFEFISRHPDRVVTALHYVAPHEFSYVPLSDRPHQVAIPGVEYFVRRQAARELRSRGIKTAPKWYFHGYRIANRLGFPVYARNTSLRLYNLLFQQTLATTRVVYTARGGFGIPIRKFFEIPAAGALLACSPCTGYADLGFEAGQHYIHAEPEELPSILLRISTGQEQQDIANHGRRLVAERHSLKARSGQIADCLHAIVRGTYMGAVWKQGSFLIQERR